MQSLSLRQRLFVQKYIETKSATQAAWYAYQCKSKNVAGVIGYENLRKPNIRAFLDSVLESAGLTDIQMAKSLRDLIGGYPIYKNVQSILKLKGYLNR